ncbi:alpha/beta fold hydrolase [Dyella sp. C9]|uniref:alpha/beta fold hydrolase n=1 Tax=Dyella sp. C9 TaxID=2202154 RepID=UPI00271521E8|nr:alpha/beta hydrolase [Dyella sp. C9]
MHAAGYPATMPIPGFFHGNYRTCGAGGLIVRGQAIESSPKATAMPLLRIESAQWPGVDLYYEDHGSGSPVVLIHGYPLSSQSWERQLPALLGAGYRVIAYDRRGFGRSSQPAAGYHYDALAADLHQLLGHLQLREFALVGCSMGGGEIARFLGRYGSSGVTGAVIIGGIPPCLAKTFDNPDGVDVAVFESIEKAVATDRYVFFAEFFRSFYNTDLFLGKRVSDRVVQASWNVAAAASSMATLACVAAWHEDFRADLASIDVPVLVIHGDDDRVVPLAAAGQRTARLVKGARLHVVKGGPHGVIWTHAEEVNAELLRFLGKSATTFQ